MNEVVGNQKKRNFKGYLIGLLICIVITALITGLSILIQVLAGRNYQDNTLLIWINALCTGGALMMMFYILVKLSDEGAYDLLGYSIKLVWYNTFRREIRKTHLAPNFHTYREEKRRKKREVNMSFIFFPGLLFLIIGLILLIPFYQNM
ncbi:MAG: DUF3899 domain-containing protein [Bacilli bacterium]|nr:DUF3899 domain-containing protein [Bacilli bacterium]